MKHLILLPAALLMVALQSRGTTISFDQLQAGEDVLNYYNGGLGSLGTGPGPSDGVTFSPGWIAGPPDVYGLPTGKSALLSGVAVVNIPGGWSGDTSFYYEGSGGVVNFYTQENGLGALVGTVSLPSEGTFFPAGGPVALFRSAVFTTTDTRIDALTNGGLVVPEPAAVTLLLLGIAALGLVARGWKRRSVQG